MITNPPGDTDDSDRDDDNPGSRGGIRSLVLALTSVVEQAITHPDVALDGNVTWRRLQDVERRRPAAARPSGPRPSTSRSETSKRAPIDTRLEAGVFVVTVDVHDTRRDDLAMGIHPESDEFVILESGTEIGRVHLPWSAVAVTDATIHNGVLTVRFEPDER